MKTYFDPIDQYSDVLHMDDIEGRAEHLQEEIEDGEILTDEELAELESLKEVIEEVGECTSETLIRHTHFKDFAKQFAEDVGALPKNPKWPLTNIDWDLAVVEFQMDYSAVDLLGQEFWWRS